MKEKRMLIALSLLGWLFLAAALACNVLARTTGSRAVSFVSVGCGAIAMILFFMYLKLKP